MVEQAATGDRWWLGFGIGGRRTRAGVVSDAGEVRRARMDETARQPFDVVWRGLLAYAREAIEAEGRRRHLRDPGAITFRTLVEGVDAGVLGAVARVMQAVGANDASSASPA